MKHFVIVGLGRFGQCMVDALMEKRCEVLVLDQSEAKVQWARDRATQVLKADVLNQETLAEVLPEGTECAIVDLGDSMERSILVTNYLKKAGVETIVVEANNSDHAEILRIVGATRIVFPEQDAADRLAGMLAGGGAVDFFAVSEGFSMIEIPVPEAWHGKSARALSLRSKYNVEVVAVRLPATTKSPENWSLVDPDAPFHPSDLVLLAGHGKHLERLAH